MFKPPKRAIYCTHQCDVGRRTRSRWLTRTSFSVGGDSLNRFYDWYTVGCVRVCVTTDPEPYVSRPHLYHCADALNFYTLWKMHLFYKTKCSMKWRMLYNEVVYGLAALVYRRQEQGLISWVGPWPWLGCEIRHLLPTCAWRRVLFVPPGRPSLTFLLTENGYNQLW